MAMGNSLGIDDLTTFGTSIYAFGPPYYNIQDYIRESIHPNVKPQNSNFFVMSACILMKVVMAFICQRETLGHQYVEIFLVAWFKKSFTYAVF